MLQSQLGTVPEPIQNAVRDMTAELHEWLAEVLEQGREEGDLTFAGSAEAMSTVVGATVQGAVQLARSLGRDHYYLTEAQLWRLLGAEKQFTDQ